MNRQQALKQIRLMQAWHEDNGDGPNADYDAICFAIEAIERSEDLEKLITALETEHAKLREMQKAQPDKDKVSDLLYHIYAIQSPHLDMTGVIAKKHYCEELWKELFGKESELPGWMS